MTDFAIRDATILEREPGSLLVRVDAPEVECGGCGSCMVKALCRGRDGSHFKVRVPVTGADPGEKGDRIRIAYRGANPAVASLVLFLPTLAGLLAGGFVASGFFGSGDTVFLLGIVAGLVLGVGVTFILSRLTPLRPEVRLAEPGK